MLPDRKVPLLEVTNGPVGAYTLYAAGHVSEEDGPVVTEAGFKELAVVNDAIAELVDEVPAEAIPRIDPRIAQRLAGADQRVPVSIWMGEKQRPPLFLELQRARLRGDILTYKDEIGYRSQLLAEQKAEAQTLQESAVALLEARGVQTSYRCAYSPCVLANVSAEDVTALLADPQIEFVELMDGKVIPENPTSGAVGIAAQTLQFWPAGFAGHGVGGLENIVALIEAVGFPNEEHFGFFDCGGGTCPRILSRTTCFNDSDGDVTCVFPSSIPEADEDDHASAVLGIILGDPHDVAGTASWDDRRGMATEAEAHLYVVPDVPGGWVAGMDHVIGSVPATEVSNMSLGNIGDDTGCAGTSTMNRKMNDLYEAGILPVKSAGNLGSSNTGDCTVTSPGASVSAFTVGGNGNTTDNSPGALESAAIYTSSSRGGTATQGNSRAIVDITAPACRSNAFSTAANSGSNAYNYSACGTSFAAPVVTGIALNLLNWAQVDHSGFLDNNPGLLHALLLTMGDRQGQAGKFLAGADNLWGVGRLNARMFNHAGLDAPWAWAAGSVCVGQGQTILVPITGTPDATLDINVVKAAIYWYDARHETGGSIDNINLALARANSGPILRTSASFTNEYEFVAARQGNGGTDNIQSFPLELRITGASVSADNAGCGTNKMLVHYAYFLEDSDRDDGDGPNSAVISIE